jgi:nucleoside-diphosphate-sugar epimerase
MDWKGLPVLVTGGASFIGSHLVDGLVERGASVFIVDDLSSGRQENIQAHLDAGKVEFMKADLRRQDVAERAVKGKSMVFHLAADHGGRGYVDLHQGACIRNLMLDGMLFEACRAAGVEKVVYASSGCVYPNHIQEDPDEMLFLTEEMVGPPYDADNTYGWAKLMAEMTLKAYHKDFGMKSASCRYFTVYGPRGVENHAVMAMIARAFIGQSPFEVWGTGEQIRNWTYVTDIVSGTIAAAEQIEDGTAVNLGTMERIRVIDAARRVLQLMEVEARIVTRPDMPTGPYNRVADNGLAERLLFWRPEVMFEDGLKRTIDWYVKTKDRKAVAGSLEGMLTEKV